MKKIISFALVVAMCLCACLALTSCGEDKGNTVEKARTTTNSLLPEVTLEKDFEVPADFKIGLITLHDELSTYDKNFIDSLKRAAAAAGLSDSQVIIKSGVEEGEACKTAAEELVAAGCKAIFADSFGHETYLLEVAKQAGNENIQFAHATGTHAHTENLPNFHNAFASIYEGRYVAGVAAGLKLNAMIEAGEITAEQAVMGYVGAFTYAEVISGYTSFYLGAKSVCPSVTMKVQFTGSWYDPDEEKNAANALIQAGCVLISQHADSLGAPTACEDAGVPNISYNGSTIAAGPDTFIVSSKIDWAPYFMYLMKNTINGTEMDADWTGTIATGSVCLSEINNYAAATGTAQVLKLVIEALKAGVINVFDADNFTVNGAKLTTYLADVDTDAAFTPDTEAIVDGVFAESAHRSAPYFDLRIDGITLVNEKY